jgi:glycosyltransferase involved in cell wall biosynthesis
MNRRKKLVHVLNGFRSGAIPHIIRDLHPTISEQYDVEVVVLGGINYTDKAISDFSDLGITVHPLNCNRWNVPQAYSRLRQFLLNANPDIVHGHMGRAEFLTPLCRPKNSRVFATHHNVKEGYHWVTRSIARVSNTMLDGRTCVSNSVKQSWYGTGNHGAIVIYNPIDMTKFAVGEGEIEAIRREFGVSNGTSLLVSVGRINKQKAHPVLLRAMQQLRAMGEDCKLVIAGRGENEAILREEISQLNLEQHVVLAGFRNDVPSLTAAADVFVFPSLWEGLGLAVLEAMATGTAVAASRLPALQESIIDGETGLLSPPGDETALSMNIRRLLRDPRLRRSLGSKAREIVSSKFDAKNIARQYLALYDAHLHGEEKC